MNTEKENKFENIYQKESDSIFRFCLVRVSNREQALDITQECFLKFWQSMQKEEPIDNARALLFTIAHRLIIDWYRKKKSLSLDGLLGEKEVLDEDMAESITIDNLEIGVEGKRLLERLNDLPPSYRQPLYLKFVEGMLPEEIGKVMGISANAAGVRVNRGIIELRKIAGYNEENK